MIEQTTNPQEKLEFKMNKQMQTFSFNPPINLFEEGKWLLAVTSFEGTNSVFNIIDENYSFSSSIPGRWRVPNCLPEEINDKLKDLLKLKSKSDIDLHVEEVRKTGKQILTGDKG